MKAQLHIEPSGSCILYCTCENEDEHAAIVAVTSGHFQFDIQMPKVKATDGSYPPMQFRFVKQQEAPRIAVPGFNGARMA